MKERITLDHGPLEFRRWLATLPPEAVFPMSRRVELAEPAITWLRAVSDRRARLIKGEDGWQEYRIHGRVEEVPGWVFYGYDRCLPGWTVGQVAADFDLYIAETDADFGEEHVEGYWAEFGPNPEVTTP